MNQKIKSNHKNKKSFFNRKKQNPNKAKPPERKEDKISTSLEKPLVEKAKDIVPFKHPTPKNYKLKFFDTFVAAKSHKDEIKELCNDCDQLNLVIRAEGDMYDPELVEIDPKIKLYAGVAWALIHDRRVEENWYDKPH